MDLISIFEKVSQPSSRSTYPTIEEEVYSGSGTIEDNFKDVLSICYELTANIKALGENQKMMKALFVLVIALVIAID